MDPPDDFRELCASLNAHAAEYLVVGGYALAFHGAPRATGDLDLLVNPTLENAQRVVAALRDFGFASFDLSVDDFAQPDRIVQLGVVPIRVDIITSIDGVEWETAWVGRANGTLGGVPVLFLGRREFVANKRAVGRPRDLGDLESLGEGN